MFITVPHFSNALAYSDYTHKRVFGLYSFDYFSRTTKYKNALCYTPDINLRILNKRLIFKQMAFLGPIIEWLVNRSELSSHLYESRLAWWIPCYEVKYELEAG